MYVWVSLRVGSCEMRKSDWSTLKDTVITNFPIKAKAGGRPAEILNCDLSAHRHLNRIQTTMSSTPPPPTVPPLTLIIAKE